MKLNKLFSPIAATWFMATIVNAACAEMEFPLPAFQAHYTVRMLGVHVGEAVRSLKLHHNHTLTLLAETYPTGITAYLRDDRIREQSVQEWLPDGVLRPVRYEYLHENSKKKRNDQVIFDWSSQQAKVVFHDQSSVLPLVAGTQDLQGAQLTLMLLLRTSPPATRDFQLIDRGKNKTMRLAYQGEERVRTELGEFLALRYERISEQDSNRASRFWFAPALQYVLVQGSHQEPNSPLVEMTLNRLDGIALPGGNAK